jgi:hypothetical protein
VLELTDVRLQTFTADVSYSPSKFSLRPDAGHASLGGRVAYEPFGVASSGTIRAGQRLSGILT